MAVLLCVLLGSIPAADPLVFTPFLWPFPFLCLFPPLAPHNPILFSLALLQPSILLRIYFGMGVNFEINHLWSLFVRKLKMPNASSYVYVVDKHSGKYNVVKSFGSFMNESAALAHGR
jgi:hypothetical protein